MPVRFALVLLLANSFLGAFASAQDLFAPARKPSEIARAEAGEDPPPVLPVPRVVDAPANSIVTDGLEESYQGINPVIPNRFGSKPEQRTWGLAGGRFIYNGEKMAPNGVQYHPYFSLDLNFNFALTKDRSLYGYIDARFWTQSNQDNVAQFSADFSKRQLDFTPGLAWNFYDRFEARVYAYSNNNLNRGNSLSSPYGYNDGVAVEGRYYFAGTDFDTGIFNFVSLGYYLSKDMIGNDGQIWEPAYFLKWSYNIPVWRQRVYVYTMGEFIMEKQNQAKWVWLDTGISGRPFSHYPLLDIRVGNEMNIDIQNSSTLMMWYVGLRFAF